MPSSLRLLNCFTFSPAIVISGKLMSLFKKHTSIRLVFEILKFIEFTEIHRISLCPGRRCSHVHIQVGVYYGMF